jgi:hypothetical protein
MAAPQARPAALRGLRVPVRRLALAALALAAVGLAAEFDGAGLPRALNAAAADLRTLPPDTPRARVERIVAGDFPGRTVAVEAGRFPDLVQVTVMGLDRDACLAAEAHARRIEGLVVSELAGYRTAADCGPKNDMTWRIMP